MAVIPSTGFRAKRAEDDDVVVNENYPFGSSITFKNTRAPENLAKLKIFSIPFTVYSHRIVYHRRCGKCSEYFIYDDMKFQMPNECVSHVEGVLNEDYPLIPSSIQYKDKFWKFGNITCPVGTLMPYIKDSHNRYYLYSERMNEDLIPELPKYNIYLALFMPTFLISGVKILKSV